MDACCYCYRLAVTTIELRNGLLRAALQRPRRVRRVCTDHIRRDARPGGWRA